MINNFIFLTVYNLILGFLLFGFFFYTIIYKKTKEPNCLSMAGVALSGAVYVFIESLIYYSLNFANYNNSLYRLTICSQVTLSTYLFWMPLFLHSYTNRSNLLKKIFKVTNPALFLFFCTILIISILHPRYIIAGINVINKNSLIFDTGIIINIRDFIFSIIFTLMTIQLMFYLIKNRGRSSKTSIISSMLIVLVFTVDDMVYWHINKYTGIFSNVYYSRISIALGLFILTAIFTRSVRFATLQHDAKHAYSLFTNKNTDFQDILNSINAVLWITSPKCDSIYYVNSAYKSIWKKEIHSLYYKPKSWLDCIHPEDQERVLDLLIINTPIEEIIIQYRILVPAEVIIREKIVPVMNSENKVEKLYRYSEVINGTMKYKYNVEGHLKDPLTNLFYRPSYITRLEGFANNDNSNSKFIDISLIHIDIVAFRDLNHTYGNTVGDKILYQLTERLLLTIRESDCLYRIGGDIFSIVLHPIKTQDEVVSYVERIKQKVLEIYEFDNMKIEIDLRMGILVFPETKTDSGQLIQNVEIALENAKIKKVHYDIYSLELNLESQRRLRIIHLLKQSVISRDFYLVFQPIVDTSGILKGVEALLRWKEKSVSYKSIEEIIRIMEENNMIILIGEWIIEEACKKCKDLIDSGLDIFISINLSAKQIETSDFESILERCLYINTLAPERIHLEITETEMLKNKSAVNKKLKLLQDKGYNISLDDFGNGFSSLGYIKSLPIDTIKVDKLFLNDVPVDLEANTLLASIIGIIKSLNKKVIIEGVETHDQLDYLQQFGAFFIQGYYFSCPIGYEDLVQKYREKSNLLSK